MAAGTSAGMDLAARVARLLSVPDERARAFVGAVTESVTAALEANRLVVLPGLGQFALRTSDGMDLEMPAAHDLVADVVAKLGEPADTVGPWVSTLVSQMREAVLKLDVVPLGDLGAFVLVMRRPEIEKHDRGHRLVKPARQEVLFRSDRKFGDLSLAFQFSEEFNKIVTERKPSSVLIVVPEKDEFASMLEYYLRSAGWTTEIVTTVLEAMEKLDRGGAYLTLLDSRVPDSQSFAGAVKLRRETSMIPLVMVYPDVNPIVRPPDLMIVGDENIAEPFEFRALLEMVDAEVVRAAEDRLLFNQMVHLQLPTDEGAIERAMEMFGRLIEASGLNDEGQVAFASAFKEALRNAADHGNRGRREKKIEIQYMLDRDKVTVVVRDYGQGFSHQNFVKSGGARDPVDVVRERKQAGKMGGLGIMMMVRCMDKVEYNDVGNRVTLTKLLAPAAAPKPPVVTATPAP